VREAIESLVERQDNPESITQVSVKTEEHVAQLRRNLGISGEPWTEEKLKLRCAQLCAAVAARNGQDVSWFEKEFGVKFDLEQFLEDRAEGRL
jgi:hypothetical protein